MSLDESYKMPEQGGLRQEFDPLPEDTYQVQILDIKLKKDQPSFKDPEVKHDLFAFTFVIVEKGEFFKRRLWKDVTQKINPAFSGGSASWLYRIYCSALGINLTEEEIKGITTKDVNNLIGRQLRLLVKHKLTKKGEIKDVIEETLPVKEELEFNPVDSVTKVKKTTDIEPITSSDEEIDVDDIPF